MRACVLFYTPIKTFFSSKKTPPTHPPIKALFSSESNFLDTARAGHALRAFKVPTLCGCPAGGGGGWLLYYTATVQSVKARMGRNTTQTTHHPPPTTRGFCHPGPRWPFTTHRRRRRRGRRNGVKAIRPALVR